MSNYILIDDNADQALAKRLLATNFSGTILEGTPETEDDYATGVVFSEAEATFSVPANAIQGYDEAADNGASMILRYDFDGCVVFIESGDNDCLAIYPVGSTIVNFLEDWDTDDQTPAELLASFGFQPDFGEVAERGDIDVMIWCEPNYYVSALGAPLAGYVKDDAGDNRIFATYDEAQAWIDDAESGIYYTEPGEAGRPAYTIVR